MSICDKYIISDFPFTNSIKLLINSRDKKTIWHISNTESIQSALLKHIKH